MDKELKRRWVEALRSGKYEQGNGCLRFGSETFCCLGVLADVADPEGWENDASASERFHRLGSAKDSEGYLRGSILALGTQRTLAGLNDRGRSFGEIADYIEKRIGEG